MLWWVIEATTPYQPPPSSQLNPFWELLLAKRSHSTFLPGIVHSRELKMWVHPDQHPCLPTPLPQGRTIQAFSAQSSLQDWTTFQLLPLLNPISSTSRQVLSPHGTHQKLPYVFLSEFFPRETDVHQLLETQI